MERERIDPTGDHPPPYGPVFRQHARFERRDRARNRRRCSVFTWQPSRWGGMVLTARWGRLGQWPRGPKALPVRPGPPGAEALDRLLRRRYARGCRLVDWRESARRPRAPGRSRTPARRGP